MITNLKVRVKIWKDGEIGQDMVLSRAKENFYRKNKENLKGRKKLKRYVKVEKIEIMIGLLLMKKDLKFWKNI